MNRTESAAAECRERFLAPAHAVAGRQGWQAVGSADTPAADAVCEIYLTIDAAAEPVRIGDAAFALYGPPVAIACADWLCSQLAGRTIAAARGLSVQDMQTALALTPEARYAGLLALDALDDALANLEA